jgi:hypothetical protein
MKHSNSVVAPSSDHPQMLDVAILLLTTARGRHPSQSSVLIEASQILLGAIAPSLEHALIDAPAQLGTLAAKPKPKSHHKAKPVTPPAPKVPASSPPPPSPAKAAAPAAVEKPGEAVDAIELQGVTVCFTRDEESVSCRGKTMEVTAQQAKLVATLLRAMPNPVNFDFVVSKMWSKPAPSSARTVLIFQIASACRDALAPIGLEIKTMKGVGMSLSKAEA